MSRHQYWKLVNREPVPATYLEMCMGFESAERIVAQTEVGPFEVSTVFLGLDHNLSRDPDAPASLFETMIFGLGESEGWKRYSTWAEAEAGHARAVEAVRQRLK